MTTTDTQQSRAKSVAVSRIESAGFQIGEQRQLAAEWAVPPTE
jgi:hypothetical protein